MMESISWIIIADANRARIFSLQTQHFANEDALDKNWRLIQELNHNDSHKKTQDAISDKAGSGDFGTFVKGSDPKDASAALFAQHLAAYLEKGRIEHHYNELILIAPPHFMGVINKHITKAVTLLVQTSIDKDYTSENEKFIAEHLKKIIGK
jgi:protein required for attachment to host cells